MGDFSFIFRTNPRGPGDFQCEPRYSEMDVVELPNGHWLAFSRSERIGGGADPGVTITRDQGHSFEHLMTGPYERVNAFATGKDEFVVFTAKSHRSDSSAGVYRWLPH